MGMEKKVQKNEVNKNSESDREKKYIFDNPIP
jgi:hypothetical protein